MKSKVFKKLSLFGVVDRTQVKNDLRVVHGLMRKGLVQKVWKKGRVFYELTQSALPALEHRRVMLLAEAQLNRQLVARRSAVYDALVEDLRFLDPTAPESQPFQFLSDWRLTRSPTWAQLQLSQYRYYQQQGIP